MTLTKKQVEYIAQLARLKLTPDEIERYQAQLSAILEYASRLQSLDTSGIPPTSSVLPPRSVLREDKARPGLSLQDLLRNAPDSQDGQFKVPPVLD
jgi:aspartyl-tRNA(Asn)/glutamyl-tRNA(Gln) amidotransferase subunit C